MKLTALLAALALSLSIPLGASAATCTGTPNDLAVEYTSSGDSADCGTLTISVSNPIDIDGTVAPGAFGGATNFGNVSLAFTVDGAPAAEGSVAVLLNGISVSNIVSASFGGVSLTFVDIGNVVSANIDPTGLPAVFEMEVRLRESGTFTVQMEVAPVPVPAAGFLLLGGLGGLAALRRKKKVA